MREREELQQRGQYPCGLQYVVEKNIFPYQEEADVMFNSSLSYELAVLKQYVEPLLFAVDKNSKEYLEAKRLLKFFDYFVGIGSECVPTNSLLREFIGGGCFQV